MKAKKFFRALRGLIATAHLSTRSDQLLGPGITQVLATPLLIASHCTYIMYTNTIDRDGRQSWQMLYGFVTLVGVTFNILPVHLLTVKSSTCMYALAEVKLRRMNRVSI